MIGLVLIGLMGSGKSTVGTIVAQRLGWEMVDADLAITERTGTTVRELWESGGEAAYRRLESETVLTALRRGAPVVIAAPGGVVLDPTVRAALQDPFVVWLRTDPAILAGRVRVGDHRPLLGDDPLSVLATMASTRTDLYREIADAVIDTDQLSADAVADRVLALLRNQP